MKYSVRIEAIWDNIEAEFPDQARQKVLALIKTLDMQPGDYDWEILVTPVPNCGRSFTYATTSVGVKDY